MTMQVEFWQLVSLLLGFFGFLFAAGRVLLVQIDRRLNDRFQSLENTREQAARHWDERFGALDAAAKTDIGQWQRLERELMTLKADMPLQYVRREDYVRGQSVIEAKLDALYSKLEMLQLRGMKHD